MKILDSIYKPFLFENPDGGFEACCLLCGVQHSWNVCSFQEYHFYLIHLLAVHTNELEKLGFEKYWIQRDILLHLRKQAKFYEDCDLPSNIYSFKRYDINANTLFDLNGAETDLIHKFIRQIR
jgi:hypothetical protein